MVPPTGNSRLVSELTQFIALTERLWAKVQEGVSGRGRGSCEVEAAIIWLAGGGACTWFGERLRLVREGFHCD